VDPSALVLECSRLQLKGEFYTPIYETPEQKKSRLPDYRTVLQWSPEIKTEHGRQTLTFYTSELPANMLWLFKILLARVYAEVV
jgi:hypothetical protein